MGAREGSGIGPLKVAIAGLGTVGGGAVKLLQANAELLAQRTGRGIRITAVSDSLPSGPRLFRSTITSGTTMP